MGLAPYGNPIYLDKIKKLVDIKNDGTFRLDQKYFDYATGLVMTNDKFNDLFDKKARKIIAFKMNLLHNFIWISKKIQKLMLEIMIKLATAIRKEFNIKNLCLAGGVALNCVANGKILQEKFLIIFGFNQQRVMRVVR